MGALASALVLKKSAHHHLINPDFLISQAYLLVGNLRLLSEGFSFLLRFFQQMTQQFSIISLLLFQSVYGKGMKMGYFLHYLIQEEDEALGRLMEKMTDSLIHHRPKPHLQIYYLTSPHILLYFLHLIHVIISHLQNNHPQFHQFINLNLNFTNYLIFLLFSIISNIIYH